MALPFEGGETSRNRGDYDVSMVPAEIRTIRRHDSDHDEGEVPTFTHDEEYKEPGNGCWGYFVDLCDRFRDALAHSCCACAMSMPSVLLLLLFIIIILGLLTAVPLFFAMAYTGPSAQKNDDYVNMGNADGGLWPDETIPVELMNIELMNTSRLLPKDVDACPGFGFHCTSDPNIIAGTNQHCNGFADCPNGSDEFGCYECLTAFSCPIKDGHREKLCLRGSDLCDGQAHCFDRSDESSLCTPHCSADQFQCPEEKMCLPKSYLCDGDSQCRNKADEKGCELATMAQSGVPDPNPASPNGSFATVSMTVSMVRMKLAVIARLAPAQRRLCARKVASASVGISSATVFPTVPVAVMRRSALATALLPSPTIRNSSSATTASCTPKCTPAVVLSLPVMVFAMNATKIRLSIAGTRSASLGERSAMAVLTAPMAPTRNPALAASTRSDARRSPRSLASQSASRTTTLCDGYRDCFNGEDEKDCTEFKGDSTFRCVKEKTCLAAIAVCNGIEECSDGSPIHPKAVKHVSDAASATTTTSATGLL